MAEDMSEAKRQINGDLDALEAELTNTEAAPLSKGEVDVLVWGVTHGIAHVSQARKLYEEMRTLRARVEELEGALKKRLKELVDSANDDGGDDG